MFSRVDRLRGFVHVLCAIILLLSASTRLHAQATNAEAGAVRTAPSPAGDSDTELRLLVGRSTLVNVGQPITRVSLTRPEVADAVVTGTQQILVHGKTPGVISMFVWDRSGGTKRYDVSVGRDLTDLSERLQQLFPGEHIEVAGTGKNVVVSGAVTSKYVIEKAAEVASGYVEKKEDVVNLLRQQEGIAANQVLLRVRFAEVSRSALTELGVSLFSDGWHNQYGRSTTQQFQAPFFDQQKPMLGNSLVFSDYLNLFLFDSKNLLGLTIRALQNRGLLETLAEPNLIAENGKEASFLAGGEYPYPVVQGTGSNLAVTIIFKEFGIRLNFLPELRGGDLIHLKVRPEVSSLDFNNAVEYQGFRIPALTTRRAETEIELQDGQTFAIAGLLNNTVTSTMQKIPGIGDIPILGYLFRSKAAQKNQTELVVMITPQILRRGAMGAAAGMPNFIEPFMTAPKKTLPAPAPRMPGGDEPDPAVTNQAAGTATAPGAQPAAQVTGTAAAPQPQDKAAQKNAADDKKARERAEKTAKEQQEKAAKEQQAIEAARKEAEARQAAETAKAEKARVAAEKKQAEEARKKEEKLAREKAKRDAEIAKQQAEAQKKQAEAEKKRQVQAAEERLKAAQAAYDAAVKKNGGE